MTLKTEFRDGFLLGRSHIAGSVDELFAESYDVAVLVPSWDRRSICIAEARHWRAAVSIILFFKTRDSQGLRDAHDKVIHDFASENCGEVTVIEADSLKVDETWLQLIKKLVVLRDARKQPLRMFIDGSACPRYYLLGLVAATLGSGLVSQISVMYAEGRYPEKGTEEPRSEEIAFTEGQWRAIAIPALEGTYSPGKKRFFLVSIGFEGWKTMRVVSRSDPDRVSILRANPGTQDEYTERALVDNQALLRHYCIPEEQIVQAPAGDAIAAWKALSESSTDRSLEENSYYLCSGTKPHSLALGLRAMCLKSPAVLYNLPEGHKVVNISPTGKYWRFEITSLTAA